MFCKEEADLFWCDVAIGAPKECWPWGNLIGEYGITWFDGRKEFAHRIAWMLHNHKGIPNRLLIRHTCNNPPCCNGSHLRLGNAKLNADDRILAGRTSDGPMKLAAMLEKLNSSSSLLVELNKYAGPMFTRKL
jgi:hypothetical protein